jgi:uncharacterized cupredoxin-like copper-binding protein
LEISSGDRIAFIGGAVGHGVFEDGVLSALLKEASPERKLDFVNLTTPGISLSPKEGLGAGVEKALQTAKADVVFAFLGAVESTAGEKGLGAFKNDLTAFLKRIRLQKSAAGGPLRVVLFGPPARERLMEPFSKEGARADALLKLYSEAMASVARAEGVAFFDLYSATQRVFATGPQRSALLPKRWGSSQSALTENGGMLTAEANRLLAPVIFEGLLAKPAPDVKSPVEAFLGGDAGRSEERAAEPQERSGELPFKLAKNLRGSLFASEQQFPSLVAPVQLELDARGRVWVLSASEKTGANRLLVLEDSDADGKADRCTVFADGLTGDASFALYRDGVLLCGAGDLWLLRDPAGAGKATQRRRLLSGLSVSSDGALRRTLVVDPKGGVLLHDRPHSGGIETGLGATLARGGAYRFEPATGRLDVVSTQANAEWSGSLLDGWGRDLFSVARGSWGALWKQAPRRIASALAVQDLREQRGLEVQVCVSGENAGIKTLHVRSEGTSTNTESVEELVSAKEPGFLPLSQTWVSASAFLFSEGDASRGRVYRVEKGEGAGSEVLRVAGQEIPVLLGALTKLSEPGLLQRARHELASRPAAEVLEALGAWEAGLSRKDPAYETLRLQSLWLRRWFDHAELEASGPLLQELLKSPDARVRAEAVRVVREVRGILPEAIKLLEPLGRDPEVLVRVEVLEAAATFAAHDRAAVGLVHKVLGMPMDAGLERLARETLQRLEPDPSRLVVPTEGKALQFVLARLSPAELAKAPGVEVIWLAQVDRTGISDAVRESALLALAKLHQTGRSVEIARAIGRLESGGAPGGALAQKLGELLLQSPVAELRAAEAAIEKLVSGSKLPGVRSAGFAAWIQAVEDFEGLWKKLEKTPERRVELVASLARARGAQARARARPVLERLLGTESSAADDLVRAAIRALPLAGEASARRNFDLLAALVVRGRLVPEAAEVIAQLPGEVAGGENGGQLGALAPVVAALTRWLETAPEQERRSPRFATVLQVGRDLAGRLEAQTAAAGRKLRGIKSEVCVVRTVLGQGRFDVQTLAASAGQALELVFENMDNVPRNLVLVAPGARAKVLEEAGKMPPNRPDGKGRLFVPAHDGILAATRLLLPGESEVLRLVVPAKAGRYEFFGTAPGSTEGMRGALEVSER